MQPIRILLACSLLTAAIVAAVSAGCGKSAEIIFECDDPIIGGECDTDAQCSPPMRCAGSGICSRFDHTGHPDPCCTVDPCDGADAGTDASAATDADAAMDASAAMDAPAEAGPACAGACVPLPPTG